MKEKITVGGVTYSVSFVQNELSFALVNSSKSKIKIQSDPLWQDWDDKDEEFNHDIKMNTNVFALSKAIVAVFVKIIKSKSPNFFFFCANSSQKGRVYHRFATLLEKALKGQYSLQPAGRHFYFTKVTNAGKSVKTFEQFLAK